MLVYVGSEPFEVASRRQAASAPHEVALSAAMPAHGAEVLPCAPMAVETNGMGYTSRKKDSRPIGKVTATKGFRRPQRVDRLSDHAPTMNPKRKSKALVMATMAACVSTGMPSACV